MRHIERIADHATNIAEDVIYLVEGDIVRHRMDQAGGRAAEIISSLGTDANMAKTKVLVIEDDRSLAEVLTYNLKQAGYEVLLATDGQDGLLQAQIKSPDIVSST